MQTQYSLLPDELGTLPCLTGDVIEVAQGAVWLTADGKDVVLGQGQRFPIAKREALLVQALAPSMLRLRRVRKPRWQDRLALVWNSLASDPT